MDLRGFAATVRHRWQVVASFVLIGVLAGIGVCILTTPKFQSTTELFLATPGWNSTRTAEGTESTPYRGNEFSRQRAVSYAKLAAGLDLATRVREKTGENIDPADLAAGISAHVVPDTVLLQISVKDPNALRAKRFADTVAAELIAEIRALETPSGSLIPTVQPVITQPATVPDRAVEPQVVLNLILGATAGALLGLSSAVAADVRSRVIRGGEQLSAISRCSVIGVLPDVPAIEDGPVRSLNVLGDAADNVRAIRIGIELGYRHVPHDVLLVTSPTPGTGTTTVASALALAIAETGRRTVLVDANLRSRQGDSHESKSPDSGLTAVVAGSVALADALETNAVTGLTYLGSGAAPDNPVPLLHSSKLRAALAELRASFEAVVVEAPPVLPYEDTLVLTPSADAVVVVAADGASRKADVVATMRALQLTGVPVLGAVLNFASNADIDVAAADYVPDSDAIGDAVQSARGNSTYERPS